MLVGLVIGVAVAVFRGFTLPFGPLLVVIAIFAALNLVTWLRLRWLERPVGEQELFLHLFSDVLILAALLYFSGGSTNPFVSLFLLPLTLAAAALPGRYTWAIAVSALVCYSLLMVWYYPLPHRHGINFNMHVVGMWFGFVLSAILISYFAVKMSATLRERERALAQAREDALRDERLVRPTSWAHRWLPWRCWPRIWKANAPRPRIWPNRFKSCAVRSRVVRKFCRSSPFPRVKCGPRAGATVVRVGSANVVALATLLAGASPVRLVTITRYS